MALATVTSLRNELSEIGAQDLFRCTFSKYQCSYITGLNETIVSIGQRKRYLLGNGLVMLDPHQPDQYDRSLVNDLSAEHLVTAAIPFDPKMGFEIIVPEVAVIFEGRGRVTISSPHDGQDRALEILYKATHGVTRNYRTKAQQPRGVIIEIETAEEFENRVSAAINAIKNTSLNKVVLSKASVITFTENAEAQLLFDDLSVDRPDTYLFSIGNYIGASPELVVNLKGNSVISHPLAGTANSACSDRLLRSDKDKHEHGIVVGQIVSRLLDLGISAQPQSKPTIANYGEIVHLGSRISGWLSPNSTATSIEIAAHLAPTAAVNGEPYDEAMQYILSNEAPRRGLYGGLVGYQKMGGDGTWILNIRSIELDNRKAILRAGVGIVDGSDPAKENLEATSKIDTIASSMLGT
ncbi:MAG: hypothetical protein EPN30_05940 [Actinomycetota bacterium]|nr:MAG: hypothetical protein EPN30_05940 [Actinomycetota bacterium]